MTSCRVCHQIMAVASIYEDLAFTLYMQFFPSSQERMTEPKAGGAEGLPAAGDVKRLKSRKAAAEL